MTAETLAAAILRNVPRFNVTVGDHTDPSVLLLEADILAALSRAMSDDLAERAGDVLEGVTPGPWRKSGASVNTKPDESAVAVCVSMGTRSREEAEDNARFIAWCREGVSALLAQNAALRAERDIALGMYLRSSDEGFRQKARAERLEAELKSVLDRESAAYTRHDAKVERLEAALRELKHRWYLGDLQEKDFAAALKGTDHE